MRKLATTTNIPLTPDLQAACETAGLVVRPFDFDNALLTGKGGRGRYRLLLAADWPVERQLHTVRQALADLGAPGFEDVPLEPFGGR